MKNKIRNAGVIILIMIIGFAFITCDPDDGSTGNDGLPPAGDGSINFSSPKTFSGVYIGTWNDVTGGYDNITPYTGGVINFTHTSGHDNRIPLTSLGSGTWEVKASSSGVSIRLGTPNPSFLFIPDLPDNFTVTDGLMSNALSGFFSSSTGGNYLGWMGAYTDTSGSAAGFMFVNKAGVVKGSYNYDDCGGHDGNYCDGGSDCPNKLIQTVTYNCEFKQGWNIVIQSYDGTGVN